MAKRIRALMNLGRRTIDLTEVWHIGSDGKPDAHHIWPKRLVDRDELRAMYPEATHSEPDWGSPT